MSDSWTASPDGSIARLEWNSRARADRQQQPATVSIGTTIHGSRLPRDGSVIESAVLWESSKSRENYRIHQHG
jgi:hypothetical protein